LAGFFLAVGGRFLASLFAAPFERLGRGSALLPAVFFLAPAAAVFPCTFAIANPLWGAKNEWRSIATGRG
jgi:hypothetical protein